MLTITDKRKERFWSKVNKTPTCWLWTGSTTRDGYGKISLGQCGIKFTYRAHRFAYLITKGEPGNNLVCHNCDTPLCVNPEHLFLGNNTDNQQDMIKKRRDNRAKGQKLSNLTDEKVLEIRRRVAAGEKQNKICSEYGLTKGGINHIVMRDTWKHI